MRYDDAIDLIATAVSKVDPSMGDIVRMMAAEGCVEATSGGNKAPGAYCTGFPKQREPRVYLSAYSGSMTNVSTLAHELGHAYHSWVMRDMPLSETRYPMNLAETASIFFETVVADALMEQAAEDPAERFKNGWYAAGSLLTSSLVSHSFCKETVVHRVGLTDSSEQVRLRVGRIVLAEHPVAF